MIAERRAPVVVRGRPSAGAWARRKTRADKTKLPLRARPGSNWRPQDLQSYALPLSYTPLTGIVQRARGFRYKQNSVLTGVGFEPTPPKRRELESPALDHSAIQPSRPAQVEQTGYAVQIVMMGRAVDSALAPGRRAKILRPNS